MAHIRLIYPNFLKSVWPRRRRTSTHKVLFGNLTYGRRAISGCEVLAARERHEAIVGGMPAKVYLDTNVYKFTYLI